MSYQLNAVSAALAVHPRTILRLTSGLPNPYWAEGYDPEVDIATIALMVGSTVDAIDLLIRNEDFALTVDEAAKMLKCTPLAVYKRRIEPDWQIGRVKRYSLKRLGGMANQ